MIHITRIYLVTNCYGDPNKVYIGKEKSHQKTPRIFKHKRIYGSDIESVYLDEIKGWDYNSWRPLEGFWIQYFKFLGFEVLNKNKNGGGGRDFNPKEVLEKLYKPILQYDLKGNFIKEWSSGKEIEKLLNIDNGSISRCCKGKIKTTSNFIWIYKNQFSEELLEKRLEIGNSQRKYHSKKAKENISKNLCKSIIQYNLKGIFIKEWSSLNEAANYYKVSQSAISDCLRGKQKTSKGFIWKYKN